MKNLIMKLAVMATALVSAFTFSAAAIGNSENIISASAASYETAYFPGSTLQVTQGAYNQFNGYSHGNQNAFDLGGNSNYVAPFTGKIIYIYPAYNVVVLQSTNKVRYADGTVDYMAVSFVHDNNISDLWEGKIINQGTVFYQPGVKDPTGKTTGTHLHICCRKGNFKRSFFANNVNLAFTGDVYPNNALVLKKSTTIKQRGGYTWRYGDIKKPTYSKLSANATKISKGESITFTASSDTATCYTIGIDKSGKRWKTANMPNGKLTVSFNEEGSYTAYVTASNSAGGLDSAKISFTVKAGTTYTDYVDRRAALYFPKYTGKSGSIVDALNSLGINSSFSYRKSIAAANSIGSPYTGSATENTKLLTLLKQAKLKRPENSTATNTSSTKKYFPKYTGSSGSIVEALKAVGADSSYAYRQKIAVANGVNSYSGTASQNVSLLNKLKNGTLIKP